MNKKEYIVPELDVVEFALQDGIAATPSIGEGEPELPDDDL